MNVVHTLRQSSQTKGKLLAGSTSRNYNNNQSKALFKDLSIKSLNTHK